MIASRVMDDIELSARLNRVDVALLRIEMMLRNQGGTKGVLGDMSAEIDQLKSAVARTARWRNAYRKVVPKLAGLMRAAQERIAYAEMTYRELNKLANRISTERDQLKQEHYAISATLDNAGIHSGVYTLPQRVQLVLDNNKALRENTKRAVETEIGSDTQGAHFRKALEEIANLDVDVFGWATQRARTAIRLACKCNEGCKCQ